MVHRFHHLSGRGVFFFSQLFVLPETEPAVHRAAHVEQKDHPVLIHLLQQPVMKLTDPGVGMTRVIEFFDKRQILVGHIPGHHHLADGMPGQTYRIFFNDLLKIVPVGFRDMMVGQGYELVGIFHGHIPMAGDHLLQKRHQQDVGQGHSVQRQCLSVPPAMPEKTDLKKSSGYPSNPVAAKSFSHLL